MTAQRIGAAGLKALLGGRTEEGRRLAEEAMAPYLGAFQAAADAEFQRGFAQRPEMDGGAAQKQLPPMAVEAGSEVALALSGGSRSDSEVAANIIAKHTAPLADMLRQLAERVGPIVELLRDGERYRAHTAECRVQVGKECDCGLDKWNKRVDEVLGEE